MSKRAIQTAKASLLSIWLYISHLAAICGLSKIDIVMNHVTHLQAAKELCLASDWSLSNLKLQKLLYIAELLFVGEYKGKDQLISGHFEAWDYGPVMPDSYHALKMFGSKPVRNIFRNVPDIDCAERKERLREVYELYGSMSAGQLVNITHWEGGAWAKKYSPGSNAEIARQDILEEYKRRENIAREAAGGG